MPRNIDLICDVPVGRVPPYASFKRQAWKTSKEENSLVSQPPWIYSAVVDGYADADLVRLVAEIVSVDMPGRVEVRGTPLLVRFADLEALHSFLSFLASQAPVDLVARRVCEFFMWTLGFRWV